MTGKTKGALPGTPRRTSLTTDSRNPSTDLRHPDCLAEALRRRVADAATRDVDLGVEVVRTIDNYQAKVAGRQAWVDFEALLPESLRRDVA